MVTYPKLFRGEFKRANFDADDTNLHCVSSVMCLQGTLVVAMFFTEVARNVHVLFVWLLAAVNIMFNLPHIWFS